MLSIIIFFFFFFAPTMFLPVSWLRHYFPGRTLLAVLASCMVGRGIVFSADCGAKVDQRIDFVRFPIRLPFGRSLLLIVLDVVLSSFVLDVSSFGG